MKAYIRILDLFPLFSELKAGKSLYEIEKEVLFECNFVSFCDITEIKSREKVLFSPQMGKSGEKLQNGEGIDAEIALDCMENLPTLQEILKNSAKSGEQSTKNVKNIGEMVALLPKFYKNYIEEVKNELKRAERLGAFAVLSSLYHEIFDASLPDFSKSERGKPFFVNDSAIFSISHSENLVCVAFCPREWGKETENTDIAEKSGDKTHFSARIGVDVEAVPSSSDERALEGAEKTARRFFSEEEYDKLNMLCKEKFTEAFALIWTLREGCVKMTGEGFSHFREADPSSVFSRSYRVKTNGKKFILSVCIG